MSDAGKINPLRLQRLTISFMSIVISLPSGVVAALLA